MLLVPLLIIGLHISPVSAVGTALLFMSLTKGCAVLTHWKQNTVDFRLAANLLVGSIPGAIVGSLIFVFSHDRLGGSFNDYLRILIGIALVVIAALSVILDHLAKQPESLRENSPVLNGREPRHAAWIGLLGGLLVSSTSIGSGSLIVLLLLIFCRRSPVILVGTDIFHGMILTSVATLTHLQFSLIDTRLVELLLLGSVTGVFVGTRFAADLEPVFLRRTLMVLVAAGGLLML